MNKNKYPQTDFGSMAEAIASDRAQTAEVSDRNRREHFRTNLMDLGPKGGLEALADVHVIPVSDESETTHIDVHRTETHSDVA